MFSYLGLTFFSYSKDPWSFDLIIVMILIVVVGRAFSTIGLYSLLHLCGYERDSPEPLTFKELVFIWYAGMIRGAIAFALVLRIQPADSINRNVIVTTCLSLVVFTTIVVGSTVGFMGNAFFKTQAHLPQVVTSDSEHSDSDVLHPNLLADDKSGLHSSRSHRRKQGCTWFRHFNEQVLKPALIFNYTKEHAREQRQMYYDFDEHGEKIEQALINDGN